MGVSTIAPNEDLWIRGTNTLKEKINILVFYQSYYCDHKVVFLNSIFSNLCIHLEYQ